ncbi:MAG: hypothetical protein QXL17_02660 [Candidatus Thermoplasmatota archaeon]
MVTKKRTKQPTKKNKISPLIIESHPKDYNGYPFITLIQYRKQHVLAIIDNIDNKCIKAYVLDMCGPENINETEIITLVEQWYKNNSKQYPLSIEFSKCGLTQQMSKIYKSFNIEYVSRVIGPVFKFPMNHIKSIKRRRRKSIPTGIKVVYNNTVIS